MNTVKEVLQCPFCGSKNVEEINRFSIINSSSMWTTDDRVDEEGECRVFAKPVEYATQQQFRCNDCHSHFEMRNFDTDIEVIKRR